MRRPVVLVAAVALLAVGACRQGGGRFSIPSGWRYVEQPGAAKPGTVAEPRPGAPVEAVPPPGAEPQPAPAGVPGAAVPVTPNEAIERLVDGNLRFVTAHRERSAGTAADIEKRAELTAGQHPFAAVLTCGDSRVAPEIVFDQTLGDLFVVRNAGNVAEPVGEGSLEYAVEHLGVAVIVVLGHESCGAVTAVVGSAESLPGHLQAVQQEMAGLHEFAAERARAGATESAVLAAAVVRNAEAQANALLAESPMLAHAARTGKVLVVPAVYSLSTGKVDFQDAVRLGAGGAEPGSH